MKSQTVLQKMQSRLDQITGLSAEGTTGMRRQSQVGTAWSRPRGRNELRQPQDGAGTSQSSSFLLEALRGNGNPFEPEDAGLTGGTRSLTRRLMGLNVTAAPRKSVATVATGMARRQVA